MSRSTAMILCVAIALALCAVLGALIGAYESNAPAGAPLADTPIQIGEVADVHGEPIRLTARSDGQERSLSISPDHDSYEELFGYIEASHSQAFDPPAWPPDAGENPVSLGIGHWHVEIHDTFVWASISIEDYCIEPLVFKSTERDETMREMIGSLVPAPDPSGDTP